MKLCIISLGFLLMPGLQAATITNGNFSNGLIGWTVSGNVSPTVNPTTGRVGVLPDSTVWNPGTTFVLPSPYTGGNYAEISNGPGAINPLPAPDYSMLTTSSAYYVIPNAGGQISFLYNLLTDEFPTGTDYATFQVLDSANHALFTQKYPISMINQSGGCTEVAAPDGSTICASSGWLTQQFSLAAFYGQNVKFAFSVYDAVSTDTPDNSVDSVLLLANVQGTGLSTTALPEPATFVLGGSALLALASLRRRASC